MSTTLDMRSARNVMPMRNFASAHGYESVELICKQTSSNKIIHRVRFDNLHEYKISPKAYQRVSEGELSLIDLQYAEYCTVAGDEWVEIFVPCGAKIISEDVLAKETF